MTKIKKNSVDYNSLSEKEEKLFGKIENAITEKAVIDFEASLERTFPKSNWSQKNWIKIAAIFIAITTLSTFIYYYCAPLNKKLYRQYFAHFSIENTSGVERGEESSKNEAFGFYAEENFDKAIFSFKRALQTNPNDSESQFLLAISFIENKQYLFALQTLQSLTEAPLNFYTDDALWYLALLQIRNSDFKKAVKSLSFIDSSSQYFSLAQELQEKIKS